MPTSPLALGSRDAVDAAVAALRRRGVPIESEPRVTGDGYYEAVVLDPERNRVELTVWDDQTAVRHSRV